MTRQHFIAMAAIVRQMLDGYYYYETPPDFADYARLPDRHNLTETACCTARRYRRACETAEAFIALAKQYNPRFDVVRFLEACGLTENTS